MDNRTSIQRFELFCQRSLLSECINWVGTKTGGSGKEYGVFWYKGKNVSAHRFIWERFFGKIPEGLFVCHKCDNPGCVNINHLFLGTAKDNMQDKVNKGRAYVGDRTGQSIGIKNNSVKLTEAQVLSIRKDSRTHRSIAKDYGVTHTLVGYIKRNKLWKHI